MRHNYLANIERYGVPNPVSVYCQFCRYELTSLGGDLTLSGSLYCHKIYHLMGARGCADQAGEIYSGRFISAQEIQMRILKVEVLHYRRRRNGSPELAALHNVNDAFEAVVEGRIPRRVSPLYCMALSLAYHLLQPLRKKRSTTETQQASRNKRAVEITVDGKVYAEDHHHLFSLDDIIT